MAIDIAVNAKTQRTGVCNAAETILFHQDCVDSGLVQKVGEALSNLSKRIGFRLAPGLSERVIYRELFPAGLTLLDLTESGSNVSFTMSHVAARQELRDLVILLQIPELAGTEISC